MLKKLKTYAKYVTVLERFNPHHSALPVPAAAWPGCPITKVY